MVQILKSMPLLLITFFAATGLKSVDGITDDVNDVSKYIPLLVIAYFFFNKK